MTCGDVVRLTNASDQVSENCRHHPVCKLTPAWHHKTNACNDEAVQCVVKPTYRDCGLDELLDLALSGIGSQGSEHLTHLGHLEHGSRVNKMRSPLHLEPFTRPNLRVSPIIQGLS